MFTVLMVVCFSSIVNFEGLTVFSLCDWFNNHPFIAIIALSEVFKSISYVNSRS